MELSQEKEKNVECIVKAASNKSKPTPPERNNGKEKESSEDLPCSEYLKMVKIKRMKNKIKLQDSDS